MELKTTNFFKELYQGYAYSYPHKHAYRRFDKKIPLKDLWDKEDKTSLFLYIHIPFCEMRCGFCNLFTIANPKENIEDEYLKTLKIQGQTIKDILGDATFGQLAVGGGTPTFLNLTQLEILFYIIEDIFKISLTHTPSSFEMSPKTISKEKVKFLYDKGVDRVSIGIQSFIDSETKLMGRPQQGNEVYKALELIRSESFPTLNIDLIYGGAGQTKESWMFSLKEALQFKPEEIYLYPLYVRPLTGLDKMGTTWDNLRRMLYRAGRDFLLENDYEQVSMRMFRRKDSKVTKRNVSYCCQEDGMIGLGSGARSYTQSLHYSSEYAVERKGVKEIIADYIAKKSGDFKIAEYGFFLNEEERKRRYLIKSLLQNDGLSNERYRTLFKKDVRFDFPNLATLASEEFLIEKQDIWYLTPSGIECSDAIGPWLYSENVKELIQQFELK